MIRQMFDDEKALEVILYIAQNSPIKDIYHVLKIQLFADRKHLERNGRFITGDQYYAMKNGPVASNAYSFLKIARGDQIYTNPKIIARIKSAMTITGNEIILHRQADCDYLSQSDRLCIDEAIRENGSLSFKELNDKSHDDLWLSADRNDEIKFETFVAYSKNRQALQDYLNLNG